MASKYEKFYNLKSNIYVPPPTLLALQLNAGYGLHIHEIFLDHTQPTQHSR